MIVSVAVSVDVDPVMYSKNVNGRVWPTDDLRSLSTAVRHDVRSIILERIQNISVFQDLGIEVRVK